MRAFVDPTFVCMLLCGRPILMHYLVVVGTLAILCPRISTHHSPPLPLTRLATSPLIGILFVPLECLLAELEYLLPIMVSMAIAKIVGDLFTMPFYEANIASKVGLPAWRSSSRAHQPFS